jgi:hypothetical protein
VAGHVARMGDNRNAYIILAGNPQEERPLRTRRRWAVNINTDLGEQNEVHGLKVGTSGWLLDV